MEEKAKQQSKTTYFVLVGMSTAILLATPVVILTAAGFFLDTLFNTSPYLLIGGGIVGFIGGITNIYKLLMKVNADTKPTKT